MSLIRRAFQDGKAGLEYGNADAGSELVAADIVRTSAQQHSAERF